MTLISLALAEFNLANSADGLSLKTVNWYRWLLDESPHSLTKWRSDQPLGELTTTALRQYIVWLRERRHTRTGELLAEQTVHDYIRALHRFFGWSAEEYDLPNPMKRITYPKHRAQPRAKAISLDDVGKMIASCDSSDKGIRDRALLAFLIDTGCRAGGVCGLRPEHVDLVGRTAVVTEKGNRTRLVCFTRRTAALLKAWLGRRKHGATALFYNIHTGAALTTDGLCKILKKIGARAGVTRCNTHAFRHAFAREYLLAGGDMATLSILLGHRQITTTADYYTVFTQHEIGRKHERYSPMNRISLAA